MTGDELLNAMEHIDAELIEAADLMPRKPNPLPYLVASLAAMAVLLIGIAFSLYEKSSGLWQMGSLPNLGATSGTDHILPKPQPFSFQIFETGLSDCYSEVPHRVEFELSTIERTENNVEPQVNISFAGTKYVVPYKHTEQGYLYNSTYDIYEMVEKNKEHIQVSVNRNTNRIDKLICSDFLYLQHLDENAQKLDKAECLAIVQDFLKQYISDVDAYQLYGDYNSVYPEFGLVYRFYFSRFIEGISSSDQAWFFITEYGDIIHYDIRGLGDMQVAELPTDEEMAQIQAGMDAKISKIYQPVEDRYDITYRIREVTFIRLADGRYAFQYSYGVKLTPHGDGLGHSEVAELIVILDT